MKQAIYKKDKRGLFGTLTIPALIGMFFLILGLQSCADEFDNLRYGGGTQIAIQIPDTDSFSFDSRAEGTQQATSAEGSFRSLWLYAFPQDGNGSKLVVKLSDLPSSVEGRYRVYRSNIAAGKYKFYLFANLDGADGYLSSADDNYFTTNSSASEDNLNGITLDFSKRQPTPGNLPMVAFPENIDNANDGVFEVQAETTNIVNVNMKFLCAKVRHTILFDNSETGISSAFHNNIIEFKDANDPATVSEMMMYTPVNANSTGNLGESWTLNIGCYEYPDHNNYPRNGSDNLYAWNEESDGSWAESGTKAWQYVTYVPEDIEGKTLFSHPYSISGVKLTDPKTFTMKDLYEKNMKEENPSLLRAKMYDVVSKITKSNFEEWETEVMMEDWTLLSIYYALHGPYELIVEKPTMNLVRTGGWETFGFQSNVDDEDIYFEYPQIEVDGVVYDFYKAQVIKPDMLDDEGHPYVFEDTWPSHFRIHVNPEIPYNVLEELKGEIDKDGNVISGSYTNSGKTYDLNKDLKYFHIVAANIHKRIDINLLNLDVFLNVSPQIITIDTREYFTSGWETNSIDIYFTTNLKETNLYDFFELDDPDSLLSGKGEIENSDDWALVLKDNDEVIHSSVGNTHKLNVSDGKLTLNVADIFNGNEVWNADNEFTLTFRLKVKNTNEVIEKSVRIIIKPFTTNYVIHFRDNTRDWDEPHIYVYQLLTLPTDLGTGVGSDGVERNNSHLAGKIVGYIENNNGLQWNGAVQYVFSNNLAFRGWKGYGGPDINNPWDEATITYNNPTDDNNSNNSTMGFVMFGTAPDNNPTAGCWNYSYAYNYTYGLTENSKRWERYNYGVNFNEDHEKNIKNWACETCKGMNHDYNGGDDRRFYTGISMEREEDGWWKYTLSGVAQPGRTMIIFANYHEPWPPAHGQYTPEDNRWPGDYESGLPLFDFEDNEAWFLFDGNTTNSDQKFYDDKPTTGVIPHKFTNAYASNMVIEVRKPLSGSIPSITINNTTYNGTDNGNNVSFSVNNSSIVNQTSFEVSVNVGGSTKKYNLSPKNFKRNGTQYITAQPLYWEFSDELLLFVKWNDHVSGQGYEPGGGTNTLIVNWSNGTLMTNERVTAKEYGNYKYVNFKTTAATTSANAQSIQLKLNDNFVKTVKVEQLPELYNPSKNPFYTPATTGYYQINVHNLE